MFPFEPTTLSPLEVVAFSAMCAVTVLGFGISAAATGIYLSMRAPRAQPVASISPAVAMARAAG